MFKLSFVGWFWVDCYAVNLREMLFDAVFQRGGHIVDRGDRQVTLHRAVT